MHNFIFWYFFFHFLYEISINFSLYYERGIILCIHASRRSKRGSLTSPTCMINYFHLLWWNTYCFLVVTFDCDFNSLHVLLFFGHFDFLNLVKLCQNWHLQFKWNKRFWRTSKVKQCWNPKISNNQLLNFLNFSNLLTVYCLILVIRAIPDFGPTNIMASVILSYEYKQSK